MDNTLVQEGQEVIPETEIHIQHEVEFQNIEILDKMERMEGEPKDDYFDSSLTEIEEEPETIPLNGKEISDPDTDHDDIEFIDLEPNSPKFATNDDDNDRKNEQQKQEHQQENASSSIKEEREIVAVLENDTAQQPVEGGENFNHENDTAQQPVEGGENFNHENDKENEIEMQDVSTPDEDYGEFQEVIRSCQEIGITPEQFLASLALWHDKKEKRGIKKLIKDVEYMIEGDKAMKEAAERELNETDFQIQKLKKENSKLRIVVEHFEEKKEALIQDKLTNNMLISSETARQDLIERENAKELSKPQLRENLAANKAKIELKQKELRELEENIFKVQENNKKLRKEKNRILTLIKKKSQPNESENVTDVEKEPQDFGVLENDDDDEDNSTEVSGFEKNFNSDSDDDDPIIISSKNSKISIKQQLELSDQESLSDNDSDVGDTNETTDGYTTQETLSDSSDSDTEVDNTKNKNNKSPNMTEKDSNENVSASLVRALNTNKISLNKLKEKTSAFLKCQYFSDSVESSTMTNSVVVMNDQCGEKMNDDNQEISFASSSSISKEIVTTHSNNNSNNANSHQEVTTTTTTTESPGTEKKAFILTRFKPRSSNRKQTKRMDKSSKIKSSITTSKISIKTVCTTKKTKKPTEQQRTLKTEQTKQSNEKKKSLVVKGNLKKLPTRKIAKMSTAAAPPPYKKKTKVTPKRKQKKKEANSKSTSTKKVKIAKMSTSAPPPSAYKKKTKVTPKRKQERKEENSNSTKKAKIAKPKKA